MFQDGKTVSAENKYVCSSHESNHHDNEGFEEIAKFEDVDWCPSNCYRYDEIYYNPYFSIDKGKLIPETENFKV